MTPDDHQLTSTPDAAPRDLPQWEQRLEDAWRLCFFILLVTLSLLQGKPFNIHLTGMLQRLANIVFVAAFVPYVLMGFILMFRRMRRNPPPNRLYAWGARLLMAGLLIGFPVALWLYLEDIAGHFSRGHLSGIEQLVIVAPLALTLMLCSMGAVLLVVAFIQDLWRLARSLWLGPLSRLRD